MRAPGGRFTHRRVVCRSRDLTSVTPGLLFDPHPDPELLRTREPSRARTLQEWTFDTFDEALESAQAGDPPANPNAWIDHEAFCWEAVDDGSPVWSGPEDQDLELLGVLIGCMVGFMVGWLWMSAAFWLDARLGLNTPQGQNSLADNVFGFFALVGGIGLIWLASYGVPALLARLVRPIRLRLEPPTTIEYASRGPDLQDSSSASPVPQLVRVTARTRNVFLAGWLTCGVTWLVAGVVAHIMSGLAGLTAFCLATGVALAVVSVLGHQRSLIAGPGGVTIRNFVRRTSIPWGELRTVEFQPIDSVPVDSAGLSAGHHRLRFNERVTAEVPIGLTRQGGYLFNLRETLLSMQRTYSTDRGTPPYAGRSASRPRNAQSPHLPGIQDTVPTPEA
jgi:hypothetical protein